MFQSLQALPADPLLGIIERYRNDSREQKLDLGVGIYKDENGNTPVLKAVKKAEQLLLSKQTSKSYLGPRGNTEYSESLARLAFGDDIFSSIEPTLAILQTPGGCGALRVAAELINKAQNGAKVWVSTPTWANHVPLLGDAGLTIESYPYYDFDHKSIDFKGMQASLSKASKGDLVLLHACCHNPSGADLTQEQWAQIISLCDERGLVPFIDMAYQGFGQGLEEDAFGLRLAVKELPEVVFAISCSKNFGLYRERTGLVGFKHASHKQANISMSNLVSIVRGIYSMPPDHGAACVAEILQSEELTQLWKSELTSMRARISDMRKMLSHGMATRNSSSDFGFVERKNGMFSFLGITPEQVAVIAEKHAIYMADSSRVNIAGLSPKNIDYLCDALCYVL